MKQTTITPTVAAPSEVTIDTDARLYVIHEARGYSCLGFDVCYEWAKALSTEMGVPFLGKPGELLLYQSYRALCAEAARRNRETGWRSTSQLTPQLIGLEGKRVEVIDCWGKKLRFWVGKSTGYIPCHLMIARRNCISGSAVYGAPFRSIRVIHGHR